MNKHYFTAHFKAQVAERQQPIDTTQLQWDSLVIFMQTIGYDPVQSPYARGFVRDDKVFRSQQYTPPKYISFEDACRMHNGIIGWVRGDIFESKYLGWELRIPAKTWNNAHESKLVHQVKLQRCNKSVFGFKVQSYWVELNEDDNNDN